MTREEKIKGLIALIDYANEALEQEQNCSEIPTGSTTKTCRSCRNFGSHHGICEICKDNKCWTEKEPTTDNNSAVDCIDRVDAIKAMQNKAKKLKNEDTINGLCGAVAILYEMPSVTPQEPQSFKWCTDCKEYDQAKHCCHRFSKVIRDTVKEMKQEQELCEYKIIEWKKDFKGYINALSMPRDDYKGIMEYIDELPVRSEDKE